MEFELDGRHYRVKKLSAFDQLHLSRRIAPLIPPLVPLVTEMGEREKKDPLSADILSLARLAGPFTEALAGMTDKDAEQVIAVTLSSVEVLTDASRNVWMPLWIVGSRMASVMELNDIGRLLPIVVRVITYNLANFMDGLLMRHDGAAPELSGANSPAAMTG